MARLKLELPEVFHFSTEIPVRITDINYGGHLGNDSILSIMHEARVQFLRQFGWKELDVEGSGIIMADAAIVYRSEVFHGDVLNVDIAVDEMNTLGCAFLYRISQKGTGKEVVRARTGIVFFDYSRRKPVEVPERFRQTFTQ